MKRVCISMLFGWVFALLFSSCNSGESKQGDALEAISSEQTADIAENDTGMIELKDSCLLYDKAGVGKALAKLDIGVRGRVIKKGPADVIKGYNDYWYKVEVAGKSGWLFGGFTNRRKGARPKLNTDYQLPDSLNYAAQVDNWEYLWQASDIFCPIGWSYDHKFAYMIIRRRHNSMEHVWQAHLFVQNMISDNIIKFYRSFELDTAISCQQFWEEHKKMIFNVLSRHDISQFMDMEFHTLPYEYMGSSYAFELKQELTSYSFVYGAAGQDVSKDVVETAKVEVRAEALGQADIYAYHRESKAAKMQSPYLKMKLVGCFKSPYTNRLAIILIIQELNTLDAVAGGYRIKVIGCDLSKGYN